MSSDSSPAQPTPSAPAGDDAPHATPGSDEETRASVSRAPGVWDSTGSGDASAAPAAATEQTERQETAGEDSSNQREEAQSIADPPNGAAAPKAEAVGSAHGSDPEAIEIEAESVRPPPPRSQRPKTAKNSTAAPLGVTASLAPAQWPPRVVGDLMTRKLITVRADEPIGDLEDYMKRFRFHHLPVVTSSMKLVGLITRTDLLHAKLGVRPDGTPVPPVDANTLAQDIMRKHIVVARIDYSVTTACRVMLENSLACLPVVHEDGALIGILTQSDFTRLALSLLEPNPS